MSDWVLEIRSGWLDNTELEISGYTVLAGFNASMKSAIIRTVYGLLAGDEKGASRLIKEPGDSVCLKIPGLGERCYSNNQLGSGLEGNIVAELVPDFRIFLREALALHDLFNILKSLREEIRGLCKDYLELIHTWGPQEEKESAEKLCDRIQGLFSSSLEELEKRSFFLIDKMKYYKAYVSEYILEDLLKADRKARKETIEVLKKRIDSQEEVREEDLTPFIIEMLRSEQHPLRVYDLRLGQRVKVPLDKVSSSIASYMTLSLVTYILAQPADVILVAIEEPEEGLAPPQQYLFSLLLAKYQQIVSKKYGRDAKILVTTHSPYIAHAAVAAQARVYYLRYNWKTKRFRAETKPYAIFAKADRLALKGIEIDDENQ